MSALDNIGQRKSQLVINLKLKYDVKTAIPFERRYEVYNVLKMRYPDRIALPIDLKFHMSDCVDLLLHVALIKNFKNGFKKGHFLKKKSFKRVLELTI